VRAHTFVGLAVETEAQAASESGFAVLSSDESQPANLDGEECNHCNLVPPANMMSDHSTIVSKLPKVMGVAADHGGFEWKQQLVLLLREAGHHVVDFGDHSIQPNDDYPDFVIPLAEAVAAGKMDRGAAIGGSGVGVCVAANKVAGVRACLIHETFSARQGVKDDDLSGDKEEGTLTTPFDMRMLNEMDRFHLLMDIVDRLQQTAGKGVYLKPQLRDKLIEHKYCIDQRGEDLPEIRNWKWGAPGAGPKG
jgi:Ribose/Galactose Isomerase/XFP C-terminal domain